jgi:hypothetical protein
MTKIRQKKQNKNSASRVHNLTRKTHTIPQSSENWQWLPTYHNQIMTQNGLNKKIIKNIFMCNGLSWQIKVLCCGRWSIRRQVLHSQTSIYYSLLSMIRTSHPESGVKTWERRLHTLPQAKGSLRRSVQIDCSLDVRTERGCSRIIHASWVPSWNDLGPAHSSRPHNGSRHIQWLQQASDTYVPAGTGQDEPIPSSKMWSLLLLQIWGFEIWCIFLFTGAGGHSLHDWTCRQILCKLRRNLGPCGASASDNAARGRQGPCHESDDSRLRQRSKERWHWLSAERDFCAGVVGICMLQLMSWSRCCRRGICNRNRYKESAELTRTNLLVCRTREGSWTTIAQETAELTRTTRVQDSRREVDNDSIRIGGFDEDYSCAGLEEGAGQR